MRRQLPRKVGPGGDETDMEKSDWTLAGMKLRMRGGSLIRSWESVVASAAIGGGRGLGVGVELVARVRI